MEKYVDKYSESQMKGGLVENLITDIKQEFLALNSNNQFEDFIQEVFTEAGYRDVSIRNIGVGYDIVLFYETSHPSWVFLRFRGDKVYVHFSFAIKTPFIPENELKRMFGINPKERYTGYVYVRLKASVLVWANVWENEIHVHHVNVIKDYELRAYLPKVIKELKQIVKELKINPRSVLMNRPRLSYEKLSCEVEEYIKYLNTEALREIKND